MFSPAYLWFRLRMLCRLKNARDDLLQALYRLYLTHHYPNMGDAGARMAQEEVVGLLPYLCSIPTYGLFGFVQGVRDAIAERKRLNPSPSTNRKEETMFSPACLWFRLRMLCRLKSPRRELIRVACGIHLAGLYHHMRTWASDDSTRLYILAEDCKKWGRKQCAETLEACRSVSTRTMFDILPRLRKENFTREGVTAEGNPFVEAWPSYLPPVPND